MADRPSRRVTLLLVGAAVLVVLLTVLRGPVVLLAVASIGLVVAAVMVALPLLRRDAVDWDWLPERAHEAPSEPGIALLRRTLAPNDQDTGAPGRLQEVLRAVAEDRAPTGPPAGSRLATYLAAPPRRLGLDEVDALVTELEALTPGATAARATPASTPSPAPQETP